MCATKLLSLSLSLFLIFHSSFHDFMKQLGTEYKIFGNTFLHAAIRLILSLSDADLDKKGKFRRFVEGRREFHRAG